MMKKNMVIKNTSWPTSLPKSSEENLMSIVCGNSHIHWSFHKGINEEAAPNLFWRTPHIKECDLASSPTLDASDPNKLDALEVLSRHLPPAVHDYLFGEDVPPSLRAAQRKLEGEYGRPELSIYIVSAVQAQSEYLHTLWKCVPCRLYVMKGDDFFTTEQNRYEGMGVDRLAAVCGAGKMEGFPALVIDGGTAYTYTAADANGNLLGGGIGPGLFSRFRSMKEYTDALPLILPSRMQARVKEAIEQKKPLSTFSLNTEDGMVYSVLSGMALGLKDNIKKWTQLVGKGKPINDDGEVSLQSQLQNFRRVVHITGGDGDILTRLMNQNKDNAFIDLVEDMSKFVSQQNCIVKHQKHLVHYGIAAAIMNHVPASYKKQQSTPSSKKNTSKAQLEKYLGAKVAKYFQANIEDESTLFKGSVVGIKHPKNESPFYVIRYDDNDREDVALPALKKMMAEHERLEKMGDPVPDKTKKRPNSSSSSSPAKKKAKSSPKPKPTKKSPQDYIQMRIAKWFDRDLFFGTITSYDPSDKLWKVIYDDNDEEEFDESDLKVSLTLYKSKKRLDSNIEQEKPIETTTETPKADAEKPAPAFTPEPSKEVKELEPTEKGPENETNIKSNGETSNKESIDLKLPPQPEIPNSPVGTDI